MSGERGLPQHERAAGDNAHAAGEIHHVPQESPKTYPRHLPPAAYSSRHPARGASAEASLEAREGTASAGWANAGPGGGVHLGPERVRLLSPCGGSQAHTVLAACTIGELASMTPRGSIGLVRVLIDREARAVPAAHGDALRDRDTSSSSAIQVTKPSIENAFWHAHRRPPKTGSHFLGRCGDGAVAWSPSKFSFGPRQTIASHPSIAHSRQRSRCGARAERWLLRRGSKAVRQ